MSGNTEEELKTKFIKWSSIELKLQIEDIKKLGDKANDDELSWLFDAEMELRRRQIEKEGK